MLINYLFCVCFNRDVVALARHKTNGCAPQNSVCFQPIRACSERSLSNGQEMAKT